MLADLKSCGATNKQKDSGTKILLVFTFMFRDIKLKVLENGTKKLPYEKMNTTYEKYI